MRIGQILNIAAAIFLTICKPALAQGPAEVRKLDARSEATANRAKMKIKPIFVDGAEAVLPESEKLLGHHGNVIIEGIISRDGEVIEPLVKLSSGIPTLDSIAMAAARGWRFTPGKDEAGLPIPVLVSMPVYLAAYNDVKEYRCDQFVRDMNWWHTVYPEKKYEEHELYKLEHRALVAHQIKLLAEVGYDRMKSTMYKFDDKWNSAIEVCKGSPSMIQMDALYG